MDLDIYDILPVSIMENSHTFRESYFDYLYLCRTCVRSFDSKTELDKCKFCGNAIIELKSVRRGRAGWKAGFKNTKIFRYFCPICEKNFISKEKFSVCNGCRTD